MFDVLGKSYPALQIGFSAPVAMGRFAGKPWQRDPTVFFKRMAGFVLSARKNLLK